MRLLTAVLLFASFHVAAEVTLTELNNNTPADADDVMGNFNALKQGVEANAAAIGSSPPTNCTADQIIKWDDTNDVWVCANNPAPPTNCNTGQTINWDGSAWVCAYQYGRSAVVTVRYGNYLGELQCHSNELSLRRCYVSRTIGGVTYRIGETLTDSPAGPEYPFLFSSNYPNPRYESTDCTGTPYWTGFYFNGDGTINPIMDANLELQAIDFSVEPLEIVWKSQLNISSNECTSYNSGFTAPLYPGIPTGFMAPPLYMDEPAKVIFNTP